MRQDGNYISYNYQHFAYLARGVYVDQVRAWMDYYPREQLMVIKSEDLFSSTSECYARLLDFLGLPPHELKSRRRYGDRGGYPEMDPKTRNYLRAYFKPHNQRLYEYLGRDMGWDDRV